MAVKLTPQRKVLAMAASQLGYSRWSDPLRGTKFARETQPVFWPRDTWLLANGISFCDIGITWTFWKALGEDFVTSGALPAGASYNTDYRAGHGGRVSKSEAAPGDVLVFDWNWNTASTNHVGILEKRLSGSRFQTIEFNTSPGSGGSQGNGGGVYRRVRKHSQVRHVIRPNWSKAGGSAESVADLDKPWNASATIQRLSKADVKEVQTQLKSKGYSLGSFGVDGSYGQDTYTAVRALQKSAGLAIDGVAGPDTIKALQAVQKAPSKKPAGKKAPAFPLPSGYYYGPKSGPRASVSGHTRNSGTSDVVLYKGDWHSKGLRQWQAQMLARGWKGIGKADGLYGAKTRKVAGQFQKAKGLKTDHKIGPKTWAAAWEEPVK